MSELTIDLPSHDHPLARLDVGGIGVHVVEGVFSDDLAERTMQRMQRMSMKRGSDKLGRPYHVITDHPLLPPPEWVALSEQKCETCDGTGDIWPEDDGVDGCHGIADGCTDCLSSGRPLVPVRVRSHICNRIGPNFGKWEYVSTGSVTVERKPLRIFDRIIPPVNVKPGEWLAWAGGHYLLQECDGFHLTTHPGQIIGPSPDTFDLDVFGILVRRQT